MEKAMGEKRVHDLYVLLAKIISETNGISLADTLEMAAHSLLAKDRASLQRDIQHFRKLLANFQQDQADITTLLEHPASLALRQFFRYFPLKYREDHIHLTGSLSPDFIFPRLKKLLQGPKKNIYKAKIVETYGPEALPIRKVEDVDRLIRLQHDEFFEKYLQILLLSKLILTNRKAHREAAYHLAERLYGQYNVGFIRLKFSFSRHSTKKEDEIPGLEKLTSEDITLGLYEGFAEFQKKHPDFDFILSPSFRKEEFFFDDSRFRSKKDHFDHQVDQIVKLVSKYPFLKEKMVDVDTVGDERGLYRKTHFGPMKYGLRRLHRHGFQIRSHHGEIWNTLRKGVQAVDNALNIWHIDTLEHGLSLGINPNFYYHILFERVVQENSKECPLKKGHTDYHEIMEMEWEDENIRDKLIKGKKLTREEILSFISTKSNTAREVEHYQHDVLNRLIDKEVTVVVLPSSNSRLSYFFPDHKDHPFSWWEKKGLCLGVGTDNYIALNTDFLQEMLILLYTDCQNLKITKLLMIATGETRRPYLGRLLWSMRELPLPADSGPSSP